MLFTTIIEHVFLYNQLDDVQKVTNDTMQVFFDQFIPEDFHEIGHIMTEGCIEEYGIIEK